jgi:hypothetical protein
MSQSDLNRAVAEATGESVETIDRQGFGLVEVPDTQRAPWIFDWDDEDARLLGATFE